MGESQGLSLSLMIRRNWAGLITISWYRSFTGRTRFLAE